MRGCVRDAVLNHIFYIVEYLKNLQNEVQLQIKQHTKDRK